jgi:hypothetical protein
MTNQAQRYEQDSPEELFEAFDRLEKEEKERLSKKSKDPSNIKIDTLKHTLNPINTPITQLEKFTPFILKKSKFQTSTAKQVLITGEHLISTPHSIDKDNGDLVFSHNYLKKSLKSYNHKTYKSFYRQFLMVTRKGTTYNKKASTYKLVNIPYEDNNTFRTVYAHDYEVDELLNEYFDIIRLYKKDDSYDIKMKNFLKKYKKFYNKRKESKNKIFSKKEEIIISLGLKTEKTNLTKSKKKSLVSLTSFHHPKLDLESKYKDIKSQLVKYSKYKPQKAKIYNTFLNRLQEYTVDNTLYFNRTHTKVGRYYDTLNLMPKYIRKRLFEDFIEIDLSNAAYRLIKNYAKKNGFYNKTLFKGIDFYIQDRDTFINLIIRDYKRDNNIKYIKDEDEIKTIIKTYFLSILFGSDLNEYTVYNEETKKSIMQIMNDSLIVQELKTSIKAIKPIIKQKGFEKLSDVFMLEETRVMGL